MDSCEWVDSVQQSVEDGAQREHIAFFDSLTVNLVLWSQAVPLQDQSSASELTDSLTVDAHRLWVYVPVSLVLFMQVLDGSTQLPHQMDRQLLLEE